jgi:hypothetical protein
MIYGNFYVEICCRTKLLCSICKKTLFKFVQQINLSFYRYRISNGLYIFRFLELVSINSKVFKVFGNNQICKYYGGKRKQLKCSHLLMCYMPLHLPYTMYPSLVWFSFCLNQSLKQTLNTNIYYVFSYFKRQKQNAQS